MVARAEVEAFEGKKDAIIAKYEQREVALHAEKKTEIEEVQAMIRLALKKLAILGEKGTYADEGQENFEPRTIVLSSEAAAEADIHDKSKNIEDEDSDFDVDYVGEGC